MKRYETYKDSNILWLDKIPSHWREEKLKHISTCNDEVLPEDTPESELIHYVEISDVDSVSGIKNHTDYTFGDAPSRARRITRKNDVIISTVRTYLKAIATVKEDGLIVSTGFAVIRPTKVDQKFLAYSLLNDDFLGEVISKSVGVSYPAINSSDLIEIKLPMPPKEEQEAIASYLDIKVGQIDSAIAEKVQMLEDLKAYRSAIINEAVTKGLDKNVEMKDSGIQWVGEIPAHWTIAPLKFNLSLKGRIGWNGLKSDEFKENSYAYLVTGKDFTYADIDWGKCYQIDKERYDEDPFIQLENGDILVTKDGTIGKVAKVSGLDKPACLNSGIFVVKQTNNVFIQTFLYWSFVSNQLTDFNNFNSTGSTIQHLYQNVFENMPLLIPPMAEQKIIAAYLDKKVGQIDATYEETKQILEELKSYKSALITEAVTGKIDLREWKPKENNI